MYPITSITAAFLAVLFVGMSLWVISLRRKEHISIGHNGTEQFQRAARAHANFAEYTPLFLILLFLAERTQTSLVALSSIAGVYVAGRILHLIGFGVLGRGPGRVLGMIATNTTLLLLAFMLIYTVIDLD